MKIKKIFTRFICFAITFALMLPMFSEMESYAANDTITVLLWKESASNSVSSSNDAETINEIITNEPDVKKYNSKSNNNWYLAHEYDHLPYNEFHNRVENDITSKDTSKGKELIIEYYNGGSGRADIWQEKGSTYLWEVKPPSYSGKNKQKGLNQLNNYIENGIGNFKRGNTDGTNIEDGEFSFSLELYCEMM